jgi:hypothetical protein
MPYHLQKPSIVHHNCNLKSYSENRKLLLNPLKTKTMIFNTLLKYDVLPQIQTETGEYLDVVEEHKILGYILRSDLKTISNTEFICKKAFRQMWLIRRLKSLGYNERLRTSFNIRRPTFSVP